MLELRGPNGDSAALTGTGGERNVARLDSYAPFWRVLLRGEMGAAESYVAGEWDADDLVGVLRLFLRNIENIESPLTRAAQIPQRLRQRLRANTRRGSKRNVQAHYDLGNDFYSLFLGPTWMYSCAVFDGCTSLEDAQRAKLDRVFDMLDLQPGDHLLDIGCGWGELAIRAALDRGCQVTGITVSRAQHALAAQRVRDAGAADRVDIRLCDYRDLDGRYDKIASVEMVEAVGFEYLESFFARCAQLLSPGGRMAVQAITVPDRRFGRYRRDTDWTQAYIFPGSSIPSRAALLDAIGPGGLAVDHLEEIGPHYAPTLATWRERFEQHADTLANLGFDDRFRRMWTMYLASSEAMFAEKVLGNIQLALA